jgi:hypothetical protein
MEDLTRLVAESMARHGLEVPVDHRRLQWSKWSRCESSFDHFVLPSKPGLLALAEELMLPGEMPTATGKRMLAVSQISEASDLGVAVVRLFAPGTPLTARLAEGRMFLRYTVIEDDVQRRSAHIALQRWLSVSAETASGILGEHGFHPVAALVAATVPGSRTKFDSQTPESNIEQPASLPDGF